MIETETNTEKPEQSWELVMDAFEQGYHIAKGLEEEQLAEELMCNVGIARGNMALATASNQYFADYIKVAGKLS